jgi:hypothetical protein
VITAEDVIPLEVGYGLPRGFISTRLNELNEQGVTLGELRKRLEQGRKFVKTDTGWRNAHGSEALARALDPRWFPSGVDL